MRTTERGFTVVELLVGAAIGAFVLWGVVALADRLIFAASSLNARLVAQANTERLIERLSSEAASAWAVWAPSNDEIDFYSQDGAHRIYRWWYRYDPQQKTITRSSGEVLGSFDSFTATPAAVTDLATAATPAYDALFANANAPNVQWPFPEVAGAIGGNAIVVLQVTSSGVNRTELFASGTAPTAFTVVVQYTPSPAPVATPTPTPLR